jgi:hypothetical protein
MRTASGRAGRVHPRGRGGDDLPRDPRADQWTFAGRAVRSRFTYAKSGGGVRGIPERVPRRMSSGWITRPSEGAVDPRMARRRTADVENWRIPPGRARPRLLRHGPSGPAVLTAAPARLRVMPRSRKSEKEKIDMGGLEGRIAIVTGAASGIGLATSKRFAAEGATVVMVDRREDEIRRAAEREDRASTRSAPTSRGARISPHSATTSPPPTVGPTCCSPTRVSPHSRRSPK